MSETEASENHLKEIEEKKLARLNVVRLAKEEKEKRKRPRCTNVLP